MKFAICQELFENWDWARQCEFAARTGYTGMEVAPFTLADAITDVSEQQFSEMKSVAQANGLEIIGLHWLLAKTEGLHLTTADVSTRKRTADYLIELTKACHKLGGDIMVFGSPAQRNLEAGMTTATAMQNAADVLRQVMPVCVDLNVRICMEPLTAKETDFVNTCAQAVELMQMVDSPGICLHQDVKAMLGAESESLPTLIDRYKDVTGHFHVNDTNLLGPGMGDTEYAPIMQALVDSKYSGWVSVEVFDYSPGAEHIAESSIAYLRKKLAEVSG